MRSMEIIAREYPANDPMRVAMCRGAKIRNVEVAETLRTIFGDLSHWAILNRHSLHRPTLGSAIRRGNLSDCGCPNGS